jgi:signal transduction histidine kinase
MISLPHWLGGVAVVLGILIVMAVVIALAAKMMRWIDEQYEEAQYRAAIKRQEREKRELIRARHAAIRAWNAD